MKARRWRRRRDHAVADLNITAFLNLMVILVPFLLVTAVFSRLAILELALPSGEGGDEAPTPAALRLEITVREAGFEVANRGGPALAIPARDGVYNYKSLSDVLKAIKAEHPAQTDATILLEPEVPYEVLIQVMDAARVGSVVQAASVVRVPLFPDISIGDAPPRAEGA